MIKKVINKEEVVNEYKQLCVKYSHKLTREEYRKEKTIISSTQIEKMWGTWKNFVAECQDTVITNRKSIVKTVDDQNLVITSVQDGSELKEEALEILENFCSVNNAKLIILWGKSLKRGACFSNTTYSRIAKYLATEVNVNNCSDVLIKDFMISPSQKNPLLNLDKITTNYRTVIVGASKQYSQILPYKPVEDFRIAFSTGTISQINYKDSVSSALDEKFETTGAIFLEKTEHRYIPRNLIIKDGKMFDITGIYSCNSFKKLTKIPAMVAGDIHFPEEDKIELEKITSFIKDNSVKTLFLHDIASWNSINHHDSHNYMNKAIRNNNSTLSLEKEYETVNNKIHNFVNSIPKVDVKIVHSNHDDFIIKWLNDGNFIKDSINAEFGAKLFIRYVNGNNILADLPKNVEVLPINIKYTIKDYQFGEHGDNGISGAKGNPKQFSKVFEKTITGHTHSPQIYENSIVVGTTSKLVLDYNNKGFTTWAHAHAVVHENSTHQLIFL